MKFEAWIIRRLVYAIMAVICLILAGFGVMEQDHVNEALTHVDTLVSVISALVLAMAGAKTGAHSDTKVTLQELANLKAKAAEGDNHEENS